MGQHRVSWQARFNTGKEQPRDQETNPNHKAEQADDAYRRKPTDTLLPQALEV